MSCYHGNLMNDGFAYMKLISLCFKFMGYQFGHSGFIDFYLAPLKEIAMKFCVLCFPDLLSRIQLQ